MSDDKQSLLNQLRASCRWLAGHGEATPADVLARTAAWCREHNIQSDVYKDGARLWECAAGYGRTYAEICAGFDSCYVSFYKGIGALFPNVASAAMTRPTPT